MIIAGVALPTDSQVRANFAKRTRRAPLYWPPSPRRSEPHHAAFTAPLGGFWEQTDLVGRECTRRQAYSADTVGRCAIEGSATMLEVVYAVASARPDRSMKANIGPLEHRSATS
eukprot:IDg9849t1